MAKQKDEIKVSLDVHQGLALTCLVMPEIDIKIDVKFEYEAAKADHKDEKSAIKEALATAVREQRVKHQEKLKKAEATLKKIAEGGGTRTAAEAILTQLNAGVLNSLRTKFPTLVKTTVGEEVKKIKSLPGLKATTTAPVPSK
ncbi:MAG TPA: hypothetical protein VGE52_11415, partial [Pirellulales bacterium]